jgi:hypothetical protein
VAARDGGKEGREGEREENAVSGLARRNNGLEIKWDGFTTEKISKFSFGSVVINFAYRARTELIG